MIEDAAHAFGSVYPNLNRVGSVGDIICFSFDGIKNITSGEGGAIVTQDKSVLAFVKDARLLGIQKDTDARYEGKRSWAFQVNHQGFRYHMSNIFAGIGLVQLERFESEFKVKRQVLAIAYTKLLSNIDNVECFDINFEHTVPHIFPIKVLKNRDELKEEFSRNNVEVGIHYFPNHKLSYFSDSDLCLPKSEALYDTLLSLPLHPEISHKDQIFICKIIKKFFD